VAKNSTSVKIESLVDYDELQRFKNAKKMEKEVTSDCKM